MELTRVPSTKWTWSDALGEDGSISPKSWGKMLGETPKTTRLPPVENEGTPFPAQILICK